MCFLVFCCFKQKTAYEMRISDWSSDVCSSDLEPTPATPTAPLLTPASPNAAQLATKADQMQVTLKPSEAAEIKLDMRKGATVNYTWSTKGGLVNVDAHGDPYDAPKGFYHGYGKDRQINGKDGVLEAAFDGKHGWFWRNRSTATVTIP